MVYPSARRFLHPVLKARAEQLQEEYLSIANAQAEGVVLDAKRAHRMSKLEGVVDCWTSVKSMTEEALELRQMIESDPQLAKEAENELDVLNERLETRSEDLERMVLPENPFANLGCILELRPGVGGSEATIFTHDLLNMYQNYAAANRWQSSIVTVTENPNGGISEGILSIDTPGAYSRLQYEGGVHRVQRIPATESKGRVHTSTSAVVVLPRFEESSADESERLFAPGEVRIDISRSSGKGGQHVNTTDSAVRLTHIPTGITVSMQDERSQHKNKAKAFMILRARLAEKERVEKETEEKSKRTAQVTTTLRSDKIRTYNYVQNRITDHRCGYTSYKLEEIMAGGGTGFDEVVDAVDEWSRNEQLKELVGN